MIIQQLVNRVEKHLILIGTEELNVDQKRIALISQKAIDTKQLYETIFPNLDSFLRHYQVEHDRQFINSFLFRYSGYIGFDMNYENFLNFVLPCEDEDLYNITINKQHLGGAKSIFNDKTCQALRDLFYAEVHYHFEVERSKKELFRDFGYDLQLHPLGQFKSIKKEQLFLDHEIQERVWRRMNGMQRRVYEKEGQKCRYFKYLLFPEDYHEQLNLKRVPTHMTENAIVQFQKAKGYTKNMNKSKYIECPKNNSSLEFYYNFDNEKTYQSDKFMINYKNSVIFRK